MGKQRGILLSDVDGPTDNSCILALVLESERDGV